MFRSTRLALCAALTLAASASAMAEHGNFADVGRPATQAEMEAWNIDVRPDFKGLPKGSGTVTRGQQIYDSRCASCHGTFAESEEVFGPLVGGTTEQDMKTGRAATLASSSPVRSTLSQDPTISTLWDYIHRAMPWNAPKSLSNDDVYAVLAYLLNLANIVPADFTLSDQTIRDVQKIMPNRNGMILDAGLWDVHGKGDTHNVACMKNCEQKVTVLSTYPVSALDSHGNLALQNRPYGAIRGADTTKPAGTRPADDAGFARVSESSGKSESTPSQQQLASKSGCLACHGVANKIVGPAFKDIAAKYHGDASAEARLVAKAKAGGSGVWGSVPMPPQTQVSDSDLHSLIKWVLAGAN